MIALFENENVAIKIHRHWYGLLGEAFGLLIIVFLLLLAGVFLNQRLPNGLTPFIGTAMLLIIWIVFSIIFTNYYLDILIVTDKRLIDIDQIGLFARDIATVPIESIQDIKIEILGLIPTFLKFGNLHIQTAGTQKEILIKYISDPEHTKDRILELSRQNLNNNL